MFSQPNDCGVPLILNYFPQDYGYENVNYSVLQDHNGLFYIGHRNGVIIYDGIRWQLININGFPVLDIDDNDRVYIGGYNDFGYLGLNKDQQICFISLFKENGFRLKKPGDVKDVTVINDEVMFQSGDQLYRFRKNEFLPVETIQKGLKIFSVHQKVFIYNHEQGLCVYSDGKIQKLKDGDYFARKGIIDILGYQDQLIIKTTDSKGFFMYRYNWEAEQLNVLSDENHLEDEKIPDDDNNTISVFYTEADEFMSKNEYVAGEVLPDGKIAIGTSRCGIIIINQQGQISDHINRQNGLIDDKVNDLIMNPSGNLWIALNNGISRLEISSPFTYFMEGSGIKGTVHSIIRFGSYLYVATTQGVYYLLEHSLNGKKDDCIYASDFLPVEGIYDECSGFIIINNNLYVISLHGIYSIDNNLARMKYREKVNVIAPCRTDSKLYYIGRKDGLCVVQINGESWKEIGKMKGIKTDILTIAEEKDGTLWAGSLYEGVFRMNFNRGFDENTTAVQFKSPAGIPSDYKWINVFSSANGTFFLTDKGIYKYNTSGRFFYPDTLLGIDFSNSNRWVYSMVEDKNNNIWISSGYTSENRKETGVAYFMETGKKYLYISSLFNRIRNIKIETIYPDLNNIVWFACHEGIIRFDPKKLKDIDVPYFPLIRRIIAGNDSVVFDGITATEQNRTNNLISSFGYRYNSFFFELSYPCFIGIKEIYYQTYLEGFDKKWSAWTTEYIKEYTNLPEGKYKLKVRAKDMYGKLSDEVSYSFSILPPLYRTWYAYLIYFVILGLFILMVIRWRSYLFAEEKHRLEMIIADRTEELIKQKERAEELVSNLLPKDTAEELKAKGKVSRHTYNMVTVLFADVQGFTKIAENTKPEVLVDELDTIFLYFDGIVEKYNIEKIKTIGDAYMCAGGIPDKNRTNPIEVVMAALEMRQYMKDLLEKTMNEWQIRIGIHTGPVISGVVGSKKLTYDIWGDTVNIASRMESSGKKGEINISGLTYELVRKYFECENRGKLPAKNKSDIDMYFVKGINPELSKGSEGLLPNTKFLTRLQLIRYDDLEEEIMNKLHKGLPKNLYYHNLKHTVDVINQVELLGKKENVTDEEILLLKTAALFHDTGFLIGYDDHEILSIKIAKEILSGFFYSDEQIRRISELIYVTKLPPEPHNLLEEIICDADLDYLGRPDFINVSQNLFRELYERGKMKEIQEWNRKQLAFVESHRYFTQSANELREPGKIKQLEELRRMVD